MIIWGRINERFFAERNREYEKLVRFFVENELEFDGDEEVDTDILNCYEVVTEDGGSLAGAAVLAKREGKFIIDGIAVDEQYRGRKIGEMLLQQIEKRIRQLGGDSLYLVARAPGFSAGTGFPPSIRRKHLTFLNVNIVRSTG